MDIRNIDIEKFAYAVELDAGQALPGLRDSLAQAKRDEFVAAPASRQRCRQRPGAGGAGAFAEVLTAAWASNK